MRKIKELNSQIEAGKGLAQEIAQKDKVCTTYLPQKKAEPALHACGLSQILKGIAQAFFNAFLIDGEWCRSPSAWLVTSHYRFVEF